MTPPPSALLLGPVRVEDLALALLLLGGTWSDLRTRRIPNAANGSAMALGLVLAAVAGGAGEAGRSAAGIAGGFALLFPFYALGGMGGGDVKFLMAIGALVRWPMAVSVLVFAGFGMAVQGLAWTLWEARKYGGVMPWLMARLDELKRKVPLEEQGTAFYTPYAVGISLGAAVARLVPWNPLDLLRGAG